MRLKINIKNQTVEEIYDEKTYEEAIKTLEDKCTELYDKSTIGTFSKIEKRIFKLQKAIELLRKVEE